MLRNYYSFLRINQEDRLMMLKLVFNRLILTAIVMLLHINSHAFDPFTKQEETFLPVSEAYLVVASIEANELVFDWAIADGYYLYQHQFSLKPASSDAINLTFQPAKKKFDEYFQKELDVYYNQTKVSTRLDQIKAPSQLRLTAQGCAEAGLCYPPEHYYFSFDGNQVTSSTKEAYKNANQSTQSIQPTSQTTSDKTSNTPQPTNPPASLLHILSAIFGAMVGGMILNLMPCVFPVLSLKALSFASTNEEGAKPHLQGWAYTAGVVISFVVAAIIILVAKSAGNQLGWGFQLQQPSFVAAMAYLFFAMGLSLSGMFHIGTQWMGAGQNLTNGHGLTPSFFTGVLAAVVASPCTAPLMAPAIGFAFTQSSVIALLVFVSLGFGMALPFLALSYSPKLVSYLPRPGAWMDTLKQLLAFPLYITSVWLLWVLGHQTSSDGISAAILGAVFLTFGIWIWQRSPRSKGGIWIIRILAISCFVITAVLTPKSGSTEQTEAHSGWTNYTTETLKSLRDQGTPVFVDLTADWCLTCKVNERVALNTPKVQSFAQENNIVMLQGDWTRQDPEISKLLEKYGRNGVPLYLMYPADNTLDAKVLPQILSESIVLTAMKASL